MKLNKVMLVRRIMNCQMVEKFSLVTRDSEPPKFFSNQNQLKTVTTANSKVFNNTPTSRSKSAMSTLEETFTRTSFLAEAQLSSTAWEKECGKSCISSRHPLIRLRFWLRQRESSPFGWEVPSSHRCPRSKPCGSINKSTTSLAHLSSTGSASEFQDARKTKCEY